VTKLVQRGFEQSTLAWIATRLAESGVPGPALLERYSLQHSYVLVPEGTSGERIRNVAEGWHSGDLIGPTLDLATQFVNEGGYRCFVTQEPFANPTSKFLSKLEPYVLYRDSVLCFATVTSGSIPELITGLAQYSSLGVLTKCEGLEQYAGAGIPDEMFQRIVSAAKYALIEAYDGDLFITWRTMA
jgi:hypothetical protein